MLILGANFERPLFLTGVAAFFFTLTYLPADLK